MKNTKNYKWEMRAHAKKKSPNLYTVQLELQKERKGEGWRSEDMGWETPSTCYTTG